MLPKKRRSAFAAKPASSLFAGMKPAKVLCTFNVELCVVDIGSSEEMSRLLAALGTVACNNIADWTIGLVVHAAAKT